MTASPKDCRAGGECAPRTFEEAADCLGHHSAQTLPVIAKRINRSYNALAKAFSPYDDQHALRGDVIVPATLASGDSPEDRNYALLDWMEAQVGRVAFVVPVAATADGMAQAHAVKTFAEYLQRSAEAASDGIYTIDEVGRIEDEANDAIRAIATHVEVLRQRLRLQDTKPAIAMVSR